MEWAERRLTEAGLLNYWGELDRANPVRWVQQAIEDNPDLASESLPWLRERGVDLSKAETFEELILRLIPSEGGCKRQPALLRESRHHSPESSARLATIRIQAARDTPRAFAAASTRLRRSGGKRMIAASLLSSFAGALAPPPAMKLSISA
jgi:hypothetical protein